VDYHSGELQSASRLRPFRWLQRSCPTHTDPQEGHTTKYPTSPTATRPASRSSRTWWSRLLGLRRGGGRPKQQDPRGRAS